MDASRRRSRRSTSRRSSRKTTSSSSPRSSPSTSGRTSDSDRRQSARKSDDANHQKNLVLLKLPHEQDAESHQPEDRRTTMRQGTERRSRRCSCGVGTDSTRLPKDSVYRDSLSRLMEREQIDRTHYKASRYPRSARETIGDVWEDDYYPDKRRRRSSYLRSKKSGWITWAISRSQPNTKRFVMVCLRELLIFSIFLFVFTWVALGALHQYRNIYCHVVMNVLTKTLYSTNQAIDAVTTTTSTYYSIKTVQDIWTYFSEHFVNVLYFYNIEDRISQQIPKLDSEKVLYENIIVGPARLRQVRVRNDSCIVPQMFRTWFNECYNYYYNMYEDRGSFGLGYAPEWAWQNSVDVTSYTGKVSTYSPDGYFIDMNKRFYVENITLRELQKSGWIDRATRAVLLEFVAYTPNTNLFAVIKLVMELPPGGGVIPTASCYSMQLISFVGLLDILNLIFAILALLFAIYFFIVLMKDLKYFGWPYLFTFWGMLDLTIIILLFLLIIVVVAREIVVHIKLPGLVKNIDDDKYGSFDMLASTQKLFYGILGVILVLCWFKVIKFFAMCTTIAVLFIAVGKSKLRLVALTFMGFILLVGFSLGAHLFFGVYMEEFSSVGNSIFTLLTIPLGGLYFHEELNYYTPILAPIFLLLFIFVFILLLLSLFVAVLVYGFERAEEKRILTAPKRKYGFYEYILRLGVVMFNKCKCKKVSRKLEQKEQSIELKKDHELIVSILARHGLRGEEMKLFLLKHGISEHSEATEDQLAKMYKDLKTKLLLEKEVATHNKLQEEVESLQKKLDEMQQQAIHLSAKPTIDQRLTS